jgi:hypothetical protein
MVQSGKKSAHPAKSLAIIGIMCIGHSILYAYNSLLFIIIDLFVFNIINYLTQPGTACLDQFSTNANKLSRARIERTVKHD